MIIDTVRTEYSLRFVGIDLDSVKKFNEKFPDIIVEKRPYFKDKSKYVLVFLLNDELDLNKIGCFLEECNEFERFDIFMAIDSETDNYIVEVPAYVLNAIRHLPIKVNVSFMYSS